MNQLSMRKSSRVMSVVFVACLAFAAHGSANVFDDAVFWFRGGKDISGDGYMQQGEFFNDLHADETGHASHSMVKMQEYTGAYANYKRNAELKTEKVVFPALGTSVSKNMQVLHLSNTAIQSGDTDYYWPRYFLPRTIFSDNHISNEYSIVGRMKLEEDGLLLARTQCLFRVGYNDSNRKGMWLGFSELDETSKTKYITGRCTPDSESNDDQFDFIDIKIPTNTWFDMAVVVGDRKLRIGIAVPTTYGSNPTLFFGETDMWTDNCELLSSDGPYRFFTSQGYQEPRGTNRMDQTCFLGSVQQLAIWNRKLTDQEVMEAFGMPRPMIFRTGFDNGNSNEFGGTRPEGDGVTQEFDGLGSWQGVWNAMKSGDTWTVNFNALRDEAGLPQIFSIKSLSDSTAQIEPKLNDTSLRGRRVAANGRTFWPVPAGLITNGVNTLVITRKDGEVGDFLIDAMELGGSLGVGTETASITDDQRTSPARIKTGVPSAADPNTRHWSQGLMPSIATNLHFRVWVDPDVVDKVTSRFWTHTRRRNGTQETEVFTLFVNNDFKTNSISSGSWEPMELSFQPGELKGGWNDFEFISAYHPACYWEFGYYRFETVLPRGFGLPPPGIAIIVR